MTRARRITCAIAVGALAALYVACSPLAFPGYRPDFDQLWEGARAWRAGDDPYAAVLAIHKARGQAFGLLYPLPAVVAVAPLSTISIEWARVLFAAASAATFAYVLLGRGSYLYPALLSGAFRAAVSGVQFAPWMACALMVPAFGWAGACKPNVGLAVWIVSRDKRRYALAALALVALSFVLWPGWFVHWCHAVGARRSFRPLILHPGGVALLLAAFRWRDPAAQWLLATAVIPGNPAIYDSLPLLVLLPVTRIQALAFALLSHGADLTGYWLARTAPTFETQMPSHATAVLWVLYLPALIVILRRPIRSNARRRCFSCSACAS